MPNPTSPESAACQRCNRPSERPLVDIRCQDSRKRWCESCAEEHAFECSDCGRLYSDNDRHTTEDDDSELCPGCQSERYTYCENCQYEMERDSDGCHWVNDDYPYCDSCYGELFFFCSYCDNDRSKDDYDRYDLATGDSFIQKICSECIDEHPDDFKECPKTGRIICLEYRHSYYYLEGEPVDRQWCSNNLDPGTLDRLSQEMDMICRQINLSRQGQSGSGRRLSISELTSRLINKSKSELSSRIAPGVSAAHNRIYTGLEIETFGGKFFTYQNSKAYLGRSITLGPHKLLSRELPLGTRMVHDGSILGNNGQEFLPPIVKKESDWNKIEKAIKTLQSFDWNTNSSCGLHMHFSHAAICPDNHKLVREIFRIFYYLEPIIFQCLPISRRDNEYCRPIAKFFTEQDMRQDFKLDYWYYGNFWKKNVRRPNDHNPHPPYISLDESGCPVGSTRFGDGKFSKVNLEIAKGQDHYFVGRYIGCNLHALYQKGTIELRYFPSVLDFTYIYSWTKAMQEVFKFALKGNTCSAIAKVMDKSIRAEDKLKELGGVLGWPKALVKFLLTEYKTHQEWKQVKKLPAIAPYDSDLPELQTARSLHEQERLRHLDEAIRQAIPIPALHPNEAQRVAAVAYPA